MSDLSKLRISGTDYNLKDAQARSDITALNGSLQAQTVHIALSGLGDGYVKYDDGNIGTGTTTTQYTDYVDVSAFDSIAYKRIIYTASSAITGMAFYDDSHLYICGVESYIKGAELGYKNVYEVNVPSNAKYARFTILKDTTTYGYFDVLGYTKILKIYDNIFSQNQASLWEKGSINTQSGNNMNPSNTPEKIRTVKHVGISSGELSVRTDNSHNLIIFAWSEDYTTFHGVLTKSGTFANVSSSTNIAKVKSYDFANNPTWRYKIVLEKVAQEDISANEGDYCYFSISTVNTINSKINSEPYYWNNETHPPYCILLLELARKYFSISNIKTLINTASANGFNQLMLHISNDTSFRLELDDMDIIANGTTYDLSECLGGLENSDKWYTQNEMDEIIEYAQSHDMSVVPMLDMPGHMGKILSVFTQFKYPGTDILLNIEDPAAVNFARAIADRYSKYFKSRGCHSYNMGFDELPNIGGSGELGYGFKYLYDNEKYQYAVDFGNGIADLLKQNGLIPRIFNEPVNFANDYKYQFDTDFEVLYWRYSANKGYATANALQRYGYKMINTNGAYYYVLGKPQLTVDVTTLNNANNILRAFSGGAINHNPYGAAFCIWCDNPLDGNEGDGGDQVLVEVTPLIEAFSKAFIRALYVK